MRIKRLIVVSAARCVTSTWIAPSPLMLPAKTSSPSLFSTSLLSPVIGAWLTLDRPAVTRPSIGARSPGLTRMMSPIRSSFTGVRFSSRPQNGHGPPL